MICFAVIDTNVLVSALLSSHDDAATVQVVNKMLSGEIVPVYSASILKEYREVLTRKRFRFSHETVHFLLSAVEKFGVCVEPSSTGEMLADPKDLPFYEVVMEKQQDDAYLVTGNVRHFPAKPFIVTAREMIELLNKRDGI